MCQISSCNQCTVVATVYAGMGGSVCIMVCVCMCSVVVCANVLVCGYVSAYMSISNLVILALLLLLTTSVPECDWQIPSLLIIFLLKVAGDS